MHAFCFYWRVKAPAAVVDQETFEYLLPLAYHWAKAQEDFVLARGNPLSPRHTRDADLAGVQNRVSVRVLVVDRIPLPEDSGLAEAAKRLGILTEDTRCMGFGHALIIRVDAWNDRELILHNLVHIAQCERSGGLEQWVQQYLVDRANCPNFTIGSLEEEARRIAREICAADVAA
ncbi:MAG TPA: hypothetical protein VEP30_07495 [Chthoniobacterales bacterium]|nr:hypothetical protein [Chthoniobacterales bacterium]